MLFRSINILIYREGAVRCGLCGFLIIKPQTVLHHAVRCIITCSAVWLCHFAGGFGAVFAVCAVYVVW